MKTYERIARVKRFLTALPAVEFCALRNQVQDSKWLDFLSRELKKPAGGGLMLECDMWQFWVKDEASLNELLVQLI